VIGDVEILPIDAEVARVRSHLRVVVKV